MALALIPSATLTIPSSDTVASSGVATGNFTTFGLVMPASLNGSTFYIYVSLDDVTYQPLTNGTGTKLGFSVNPTNTGGYSCQLPAGLGLWPYFKIVSADTQSAARDFMITGTK